MQYLTRLIEGYRRFRENDWSSERERWSELAEGQSPKVMILSCADSRVDPAQIFDARPGEMFVVPRGKEHRPRAVAECKIMLIEPVGTANTGDAGGRMTAPNDVWI